MSSNVWVREHHVGRAADFHGRDLPVPATRAVWWFEVAGPTVVLGSTQAPGVVDASAAAAAGAEVVRRRSGGGAVWLVPGGATWIDVVLPAGDRWWVDDVGASARWLGDAWVGVLAGLGVPDAIAHHGPMVRSPGSELICFAGLAPGEVTVDGRKAVGIAQRRTRHGARFQCAVLHEWEPAPLLGLLDLPPAEREVLAGQVADAGAGIGPVPAAEVVDRLVAVLGSLDR